MIICVNAQKRVLNKPQSVFWALKTCTSKWALQAKELESTLEGEVSTAVSVCCNHFHY